MDKDTGEHYMNALCYLTEEDLESGDYEYEPVERWLLSLPISHTIDQGGCPLAVLRTDFSYDETCFLLGEHAYDSKKFHNLGVRAECADAEFSARLEFLTNGTPFDVPFDGTCMDVEDPADRAGLCELLESNTEVYVAPSIHNEAEYCVYALEVNQYGLLQTGWEEFIIKHTDPGKGLESTLEGKISWAKHLSNKTKKAEPAKTKGKEPEKKGSR